MVSFTPQPLNPGDGAPDEHCMGDCVGRTPGLGVLVTRKFLSSTEPQLLACHCNDSSILVQSSVAL
jgi:hypothetical protein